MSMIAIECRCLVMVQGSVCNLVCGDGEMVTSGPVLHPLELAMNLCEECAYKLQAFTFKT